jgi:hypothetical protein
MNAYESFPMEKYIEFDNDPYFLGRITVNKFKTQFHVELDIVHKETHKIYKHLGRLYDFDELSDALETGYHQFVKIIGNKQDPF